MNREIKFRAWSAFHDKKELIYLNEFTSKDLKSCDNWIVMQYTGFVDKNGIKIFEGDVVSVCYDGKDQDCWEAVVEWCKINPSFFLKKVNPPCSSLNEYDFIKCGLFELLVIGNIYENPELIKEVKNV